MCIYHHLHIIIIVFFVVEDPTGSVVDGVPQKGTEDQLLDGKNYKQLKEDYH